MISATINMKGGRGNNEKFSAHKRAMNYKASRKPPTTNPRITHAFGHHNYVVAFIRFLKWRGHQT